MTDNHCRSICDLLVEYDDGELEAHQAAEVAEHLAGCPSCLRRLESLRDSLKLAREVWDEAAEELKDLRVPLVRRRRIGWKPVAAAAACIVLAVGAGLWVLLSPPKNALPPVVASEPLTAEQVARLVERRAASARLAASAEILAAQPGREQLAAASLRYLAEAYPDTPAGKEARAKILPN